MLINGMQSDFIKWVLDNTPMGSIILELGAGYNSTKTLSEKYKMYSVEHNEKYCNLYNSTYIHAPLKNDWYCVDTLKENIPNLYDLIIVDGPPGMLNGNNQIRYGFIKNLDLFRMDVPVIFDDTNRDGWGEVNAVNYLKHKHNYLIEKHPTFTVCFPQ